MKLKVGDYVVFRDGSLDDWPNDQNLLGTVYKVRRADAYVYIRSGSNIGGWLEHRFRLATDEEVFTARLMGEV